MTNDPELVAILIKMVVFLLLMAGGAVLVIYMLKRFTPATGHAASRQLINVLSTRPIAPKKSVALIQVPGAVLVIGIAADTLTLLTKIEDPEIVDELSQQPAKPSFPDLLSRFGNRSPKD